ncbi:MAG: hypothetical protein AVDCRST_MAG79-2843 [uncultured Thermoleophilia bacterium]|uniref:Uncharacterized protein n=1 Tax=uncultured Thermoleophilia bacterium TaxID=1497501 RepID=A0A6J4ULS0_9ACTN|nr:MAG: hypothetical protein AVDCRST_MAG79-2843 [uncultured Thermoleophilia bacterium]
MGDHRHELVLGAVELAQPVGRRLLEAQALRQRLLRPSPLREISGDLREAAQPTVVVAQGGDDDVGPEPRAVLPHAPALVLDAPHGHGLAELGVRLAGLDVGLRVEAREVAADDLSGRVPLEAARAGVPRRHVAGGVEHEDGVVDDVLDHQPQALLAEREGALGRPPLGEVPRHLAEAEERPGLVTQRRDDHVRPERDAVLPDAPALVLDATVGRGARQLPLGLSAADVLVRIEPGVVGPDDLLGPVALEPPGACVPRCDVPVRVQQEDGVVGDALDQEPEEALRCGRRRPHDVPVEVVGRHSRERTARSGMLRGWSFRPVDRPRRRWTGCREWWRGAAVGLVPSRRRPGPLHRPACQPMPWL